MLKVDGIEASYGSSQVLFGVSLDIAAGEVVTLLGRNGMGKTTTVKSIMGIIQPHGGTVTFRDSAISGWPAYRIARCGMGLVPEGRQIFPNLSVHENLVATAANRNGQHRPWTVERVYEMFPSLAQRSSSMGTMLSGGEQQMLAMGRALMTNPLLLILDEATEGLAPRIRQDIWRCISTLKEDGLSILVIDKNIDALTRIGDRHYIIEKGKVAWVGSSAELRHAANVQKKYLGV